MDFVSPETVMGWKFQSYHDTMLVVVVVVLVLVSFYSMVVFRFFGLNKGQMDLSFNKNSILEVAWTLLPGFVLMFVGFISLENLYHFNKTGKIENSFSAVGHQWFWEYVYEVDGSSSKLEKELGAGQFMVLMKQQVWENLMKSMEMMDEKSKSHLVSILASLEKSRGIGDMELKSIETKLDGLLKKLSLAVLESGFDKVLKKEMSIDEFMDRASKKINPIIEESDSVFDSVSSIKQHLMGIGMKKGEMPKEDERSFLGKVFYYFFSWPIHVYNYFFVEESKSDLEQSKMVLGEAKKNNKETFDAHSWLVSHFSPSWLLPSDMTSNKNFTGKYMNSVPLSLNPKAFIEGGSTPCRLRYSSMMVSEEDLTDSKGPSANGFRLMDVTMPCFMKRGVMNEVLVSTVDVMHSWGVPSLGVKVDAVPGRVNSVTCTPENCGLFYGFCYELCGAGHSKMPIGAAVLELNDFNDCLQMLVMKESSLKFDSDFKDISPGPDFWDTKPDQTIHEPAHFILGSGVMSPIGTLLCILFMEVMLLNGGVLSLINILFVMMHFYLQEGLTEEVSDIMRRYVSWLHELQERWEDVENHTRELEARNRNLQNLVNLLNGEEGGLGFSRSSDSAIHSPDFSPDQTSVMSEEVLVHYEPGDFIPRFLEDDRRSSSLDTIMSWDSEELEMLYSLSQEGLTNTDVTGVDHDVNWSDVTTPSTGWKAMFGRQISNMTSFVSNLASSIFTKMSEMGFRFGPVVSEDAPGSDSSDNWSTTSEWTTDDEAGGSPTPPTFVPRRGPNGETSLFNLTVEELLAKQNSGKLSSEELELLEKVTEKPSRGLKKSKSLSDMSDLVKPEKEGDITKSQSLTSCFNEDINNNLPMGFKKTSLSESSSFTVSNSSDLATQENLPETSEGLKPGDLSEKTSGHGSSVEVSSSSSSEGIFDAVGAMATVDLIHTEEEKVNVDKNDIEENKSSEEKKSEYSPDDGEEPSCSYHYSDEPASSMSSKPDTGVGKASSISTLDELKVDSSIPLPPKSKSTGDPVVVEDIVPLKDQKSSQFANFSNLVTAVTSGSGGLEVTERRSISTLSELKKEDSSSSLRKTKSEGDLSKVKEIIPLKNQQSSQFADLSTFVGAKSKDSGSSEVIGSKSIGTIEELKPVDRSYSLRESKSTGDLSKVKEDPFITMKDSNGPLIPKSNSLSNLDDLKTDDSPSLRKSMSASDISKISNLTPLKDQKSSQLSTCENLLDTSQSGSERWVDATSSLGGSTSSVNSSPEEKKVSSLASAQGLPSGSAPSTSEALSASVSEVAGCSMESTSKDSSSLSGSVPSTSKALSTSVSEVAGCSMESTSKDSSSLGGSVPSTSEALSASVSEVVGCSMESTSKDSSSLSGSVPSTSKALSTSVSEVAGCSMESASKDSSSLGGSVPSTSEALSASVSEVVGCLMESTFKDSSSPSGSAPQTSETLSAEVSEVAGCSKEGNSISEDQKTSHPPNQVSWEQGEMDKEKKSSLTNLELEKEGFKGSVKSMSMSDVSGLSGGSSEFSEYKYGLLRKWKSMENLADWKQGFKLKSASDLVPFAQDSSKDLWWDGEKLYFMASSKSGSFDSIMAKISDLEMMLLEMSASKSLKISGSSKSGETSSFLLLKKESSSESFIWDKGAENPLSPSSSGGKNNPPLLGLKHLEWKKGVTGTSTPKLNEDKPGPSGYVDSPDPRPIMSILSLDDKSESLPSFSLSGEMDRLINFPKSSSIDNSKGKLSEDINKLTYSFSVMKISEQESKDFSPSSLPKECFELETPNDSDSLNNLKNKKILLIPLSGNEGFSTLKSQKDSYKIVDVSLSSSGSSFELSKGKSMLNEVSKAILTKNSLSMCLDSEKSEESSSLGAVGGVKNFPSNSVSESVSNLAVGFKEEDSLPIVKNTDSDLQVSLSVSSSSKMS